MWSSVLGVVYKKTIWLNSEIFHPKMKLFSELKYSR